jgi:uncharacterized protein
MRLTEVEIATIKELARMHFGNDVQVFLFGSRVKNELRGGDIDLFIRNQAGKQPTVRSKINFISDLMTKIGEQKIDVVLDHPAIRNSFFFKAIINTGIQLC